MEVIFGRRGGDCVVKCTIMSLITLETKRQEIFLSSADAYVGLHRCHQGRRRHVQSLWQVWPIRVQRDGHLSLQQGRLLCSCVASVLAVMRLLGRGFDFALETSILRFFWHILLFALCQLTPCSRRSAKKSTLSNSSKSDLF